MNANMEKSSKGWSNNPLSPSSWGLIDYIVRLVFVIYWILVIFL